MQRERASIEEKKRRKESCDQNARRAKEGERKEYAKREPWVQTTCVVHARGALGDGSTKGSGWLRDMDSWTVCFARTGIAITME